MNLKVVTFNMQYGQLWDEANPDSAPINLGRSIKTLLRQDADLIFLQEVEQVRPELGQVNPPPNFICLKEAMSGYHGIFSYPPEDRRELPFGYGLAIFSKTPLYNVEVIPLPAPDLEFDFCGERKQPTQRVMLGARTRLGGREVQLYNVHLQAFFIIGQSSDDHPGQRKKVLDRLRGSAVPTLLCGDLNAAPGEATVAEFESAGMATVQRSSLTWRRMPFVLDHIMHSRDFEAKACRVETTDASDHMLLAGELVMKPRMEAPSARNGETARDIAATKLQ